MKRGLRKMMLVGTDAAAAGVGVWADTLAAYLT